MTSLLKEFTGIPMGQKVDLKRSDGSDAGKSDVTGKVRPNDVQFSLMRNTINSDGEVQGSDVADYLERAHELNDEIDTVPFGIETDDGDIVKVYVNAEQADKFEEEMQKILGIEDDVEEAINKLALQFDIVDVVWPEKKEDGATPSEPEVQVDHDSEFDALDDGDHEPSTSQFEPLGEHVSNPALHEFMPVIKDKEVHGDPKAPTPEEAAAYRELTEIVSQLSGMGPSGVSAATGFDRGGMTKAEMIKKYVSEKYESKCELVRCWMRRLSEAGGKEVHPFWLQEEANVVGQAATTAATAAEKAGEKNMQKSEVAKDQKTLNVAPKIGSVSTAAKEIITALGLPFDNPRIVKIVNQQQYADSINKAARDPKVKRAMLAFMQAMK
jgi:hypothetical protein